MRIISGEAKGVRLKVPASARPTTSRVKGAIFSILGNEVVNGAKVLDLYAGSGALGIEALSRGAGWADFVERAPRSCALLRENLRQAGLQERSRVYCAPVERTLTRLSEAYDLVFIDPPYSQPLDTTLEAATLSHCLRPGSLVVVPHSSRLTPRPSYDGLSLIKQRRHGDTCISIFRKEAG